MAEEMVPKAAFDALVQQIASLQATIDRLTALLEEKNQIILNQNRARFGQSSEKRTYLLSDGQMCLFDQAGDGITENTSGEESHTEEITVAAHTEVQAHVWRAGSESSGRRCDRRSS